VAISQEMLDRAAAELPELPLARAERFERDLGLSADSAHLLAFRSELGDYFEAAVDAANGVRATVDPQVLANWLANDLASRIGADTDPAETKVAPGALAKLVEMVGAKQVTQGGARQVLDRLVAEGGDPARIVEAEGLGAVGGADELAPIVEAALAANPDVAEKLRGGDMKPIGVIVGHVMRETKGRADGGEVTRLVRQQLGL
jgi:aspartyl-tRNA(Asn)/glutamyl-tRNA(Gln) amidotransferase subunit B